MRTRTTDRRIHPRFKTDFSVHLCLESQGETYRFQARSVDISRHGIQIEGSREMMDCFMAQRDYPHSCELFFKLPGDQKGIKVHCHMVTHRRLSQKLFYLALNFMTYEGDSEALLENYLLSLGPSSGTSRNGTVISMPQRMRA